MVLLDSCHIVVTNIYIGIFLFYIYTLVIFTVCRVTLCSDLGKLLNLRFWLPIKWQGFEVYLFVNFFIFLLNIELSRNELLWICLWELLTINVWYRSSMRTLIKPVSATRSITKIVCHDSLSLHGREFALPHNSCIIFVAILWAPAFNISNVLVKSLNLGWSSWNRVPLIYFNWKSIFLVIVSNDLTLRYLFVKVFIK